MKQLPQNAQAVASAKAVGKTATEYRIKGVPGLVLLCQPSGRAAYYFFYSRTVRGGRKLRKVRIGARGPLTLAEAKRAALGLAASVEAGGDPADRQKQDTRLTFRGLAERRLDEDRSLAPRTAAGYRHVLARHVFPEIGESDAATLTKSAVRGALNPISSDRQADIARAAIGSTYRWAIRQGYLEENPAAGLGQRQAIAPRTRTLSTSELGRLLTGLDDPHSPLDPVMRSILRIALYSAQRRNEVAFAQVSEFDFTSDPPTWTIPGRSRLGGTIDYGRSKNRQTQILPLTPRLSDLFRSAVRKHGAGDFVFVPSARVGIRLRAVRGESVSRAMSRLRSHIGVPDITVHDLRRTASTFWGLAGVPPHINDALLNHRPAATNTTARHYNFARYTSDMLAALDLWGRHLDSLPHG